MKKKLNKELLPRERILSEEETLILRKKLAVENPLPKEELSRDNLLPKDKDKEKLFKLATTTLRSYFGVFVLSLIIIGLCDLSNTACTGFKSTHT